MLRYLQASFLFTCNDFKVILIPHTLVGLLQAATGSVLTTNESPSLPAIWKRLPYVVAWNWLNLLVFNLATQRTDDSIAEDRLNRPWRPIASGLISPGEAKRWLLALIPVVFGVSVLMGAGHETLLMLALVWMYNDLGGGSDNFITRNSINGLAFALHNYASTKVAASGAGTGTAGLNEVAASWLTIIGCIVFTTIQLQDLPDMEGDQKRGRKTIPLVFGEWPCRVGIAVNVVLWSLASLFFWRLHDSTFPCVMLLSVGCAVALRVLVFRDVPSDERTYKLWCVWLALVYSLPFVYSLRLPRTFHVE